MKYYIQILAEGDKGVVLNQNVLSVCDTETFDTIVEAEEMCRKVIRSKIIHKHVERTVTNNKLGRLRLTLTVIDENGNNVNDHYWYHECKVVNRKE